jgi:hypothetical protein
MQQRRGSGAHRDRIVHTMPYLPSRQASQQAVATRERSQDGGAPEAGVAAGRRQGIRHSDHSLLSCSLLPLHATSGATQATQYLSSSLVCAICCGSCRGSS